MSSLYLHPLAYLVGLEGVALMKAFAGEYDRDFTHARLAEVRRLLDSPERWGDGVELAPLSTPDAYDGWSSTYDDPDNGYFAMDEAALLPMIDRLPVGVAVDAACGTGRYAAHLAALGHRVHGFDTSPGMIAVARAKVPAAVVGLADMADLPLADGSVDLVVNTLAMTHVEDLGPVFDEAARVLRPGGHLLVSDVRGYFPGSDLTPLVEETTTGELGYMRSWSHPTSHYLQAAIPAGFLVRDCRELEVGAAQQDEPTEPPAPPALPVPGEPPSIWALHAWVPEAAHAVHGRRRCLVVWDFERDV
ncbi:MAG: class I SAM-dependent methyltransferase [Nocardioides sp.]